MDIIEKSLEIALKAHAGKKDKAGDVYILHPLRIMMHMRTKEEMSVAILHDVIEDSDYTAEDLLSEGIPKNIVNAVILLTKVDGENYEKFIKNLSKNKLSLNVKKSDIEDNINMLRLNVIDNIDIKRMKKYHKAWKILKKEDELNY